MLSECLATVGGEALLRVSYLGVAKTRPESTRVLGEGAMDEVKIAGYEVMVPFPSATVWAAGV